MEVKAEHMPIILQWPAASFYRRCNEGRLGEKFVNPGRGRNRATFEPNDIIRAIVFRWASLLGYSFDIAESIARQTESWPDDKSIRMSSQTREGFFIDELPTGAFIEKLTLNIVLNIGDVRREVRKIFGE